MTNTLQLPPFSQTIPSDEGALGFDAEGLRLGLGGYAIPLDAPILPANHPTHGGVYVMGDEGPVIAPFDRGAGGQPLDVDPYAAYHVPGLIPLWVGAKEMSTDWANAEFSLGQPCQLHSLRVRALMGTGTLTYRLHNRTTGQVVLDAGLFVTGVKSVTTAVNTPLAIGRYQWEVRQNANANLVLEALTGSTEWGREPQTHVFSLKVY